MPRETAQETLGHHVHVDLTGTWSSTPWNPSRDARGVPLPQPEETTLSSRFQLPEDLIGHGSVLVLEGLSWTATVTVNGQDLSPVTGGPNPVEVPLGPHLVPGENVISLVISGPADAQTLLVGHTEPAAMLASSPRCLLYTSPSPRD